MDNWTAPQYGVIRPTCRSWISSVRPPSNRLNYCKPHPYIVYIPFNYSSNESFALIICVLCACVLNAVGVIEIIFWNCFIYTTLQGFLRSLGCGPLCCIVKHEGTLNENRFVFAKCVQIDVTHIRLCNIGTYMRYIALIWPLHICDVYSLVRYISRLKISSRL